MGGYTPYGIGEKNADQETARKDAEDHRVAFDDIPEDKDTRPVPEDALEEAPYCGVLS